MSKAVSPLPSFGVWLQQQRKEHDLTQEGLADLVGCKADTIRSIETRRRIASKQMAELLAKHLGVPEEDRPALVQFARAERLLRGSGVGGRGSKPAGEAHTATPRGATVTNLPAWRTPFIGREQERARVRELLMRESMRLLTLTGAPGIGKTRLSAQVGADIAEEAAHFPDGVFIVFLSTVPDASLVVPVIEQALEVKEEPNRPGLELLTEYLRDKRLLLILDNFEHIIDARLFVVELLSACPGLKVMASSRQRLDVYGEQEFVVAPLALPGPHDVPGLEELAGYDSVKLFTQRSQAVNQDFALTADNGPAVAEICRQLDGLPLAIELAAARSKVLTPQAIRARLNDKLDLLTMGMRDLPARQQTLRGAIAWSYDSLDGDERKLLRRMAVFVGGGTLEAVEAVGGGTDDGRGPAAEDGRWTMDDEGADASSTTLSSIVHRPSSVSALTPLTADVLDVVSSLVDKSLIRPLLGGDRVEAPAVEPRFTMLWTIREYGRERLAEEGEEEAVRQAHGRFFLGLAEEAKPHLRGPEQAEWLQRLEEEHDNLRAALDWNASYDLVMYGRLAGALWRFWYVRGYLNEGRRWVEAALELDEGKVLPAGLRAAICYGAGALAFNQGDHRRALAFFNESLGLNREVGDTGGIADCLDGLGLVATQQGDYRRAKEVLNEGLALRRKEADKCGMVGTLNNLAHLHTIVGGYEQAKVFLEEGLTLVRQLRDLAVTAILMNNLGHISRNLGDYARARSLYEGSLSIKRRLGDRTGIASSLNSLGEVERHEGDYEAARALLEESLGMYRALGERESIGMALNNLGHVMRDMGDFEAARLYYAESLEMLRDLGSNQGIAVALLGLAAIEQARNRTGQAAGLVGAVDGMIESIGATLEPSDQAERERIVTAARATMGEEGFEEAWAAGHGMSLEQVVDEAGGWGSVAGRR
ncbi:MAG: tetratricopeptide repeat protein [Chloroflexia bacterium]